MAEARRLRHALMNSPAGPLQIVASERGISGIYWENHSHPPGPEVLGERLPSLDTDALISQCATELAEYFSGTRKEFEVPLDAQGTEFQHRVWDQLSRIPCGESRSYGQLALVLGDAKLTRAVGAANGRNPISIIVPCHRVIGSDRSLTGYAGGLEAKLFLLRLEGIEPAAEETLF